MSLTLFEKRLQVRRRKTDRTFTTFDIIRISCLNLSREEFRNVFLFFLVGVPIILAVEQKILLLIGARIPRTVAGVIIKILRFFTGLELIDFLNIIDFTFEDHEVETLKKCVKRLHKLFPR